jgi:hypothetical protein
MLIWERRERRKPQAPDTEAEDCWRQRVPHSLCADSIRTLLLRPYSLPCSIRLPFRPLLTCLSARVSLAFPPGSHLPLRPLLTCLSARFSLALPPSSHLPFRPLLTCLSALSFLASRRTGAAGGTDDPQFLWLAFSRHRMRSRCSHACPNPLAAMARRVRCGTGAHIDAQTRTRPPGRARIRIWWSPLRPGPVRPGSQELTPGADMRTPTSRNPPAASPPVRWPP